MAALSNWTECVTFYFQFNSIYIVTLFICSTECPAFSNERHASCRLGACPGSCHYCKGFDLQHDASHPSQVGKICFAVGKDEAEISQQVRGEEKELHLSHSLPQTESCSASKWDQGADGASSSFQETLWNT